MNEGTLLTFLAFGIGVLQFGGALFLGGVATNDRMMAVVRTGQGLGAGSEQSRRSCLSVVPEERRARWPSAVLPSRP